MLWLRWVCMCMLPCKSLECAHICTDKITCLKVFIFTFFTSSTAPWPGVLFFSILICFCGLSRSRSLLPTLLLRSSFVLRSPPLSNSPGDFYFVGPWHLSLISVHIFCDNINALYMAINPMFHVHIKHVEIDYYSVCEKVVNGNVTTTILKRPKDIWK
jgi:hypothetical protein